MTRTTPITKTAVNTIKSGRNIMCAPPEESIHQSSGEALVSVENLGQRAPNAGFVPLQLIWDHDGKRIIDTETDCDLTARYGIKTIIADEDGCIALKLAPGLGVEVIDMRYVATAGASRPAEAVNRKIEGLIQK